LQSIDRQTAIPDHRRDLIELTIAYGAILAVVWTPRPAQRLLWLFAVAVIVAVAWRSSETLKSMGLHAANFIRSSWIVALSLILAAGAVVVAARMHTLRWPGGPIQFIEVYAAYIVWAFAQQFMLLSIFLSRLLRLLPNANSAAIWAALIFGVAHLPNPVLVPITLVLGLVGCLVFLRYRNMLPIAMAHAILGVSINMTVPGPIDHNMRVGLGYLNYHDRSLARSRPTNPSTQP
jgi:hypothetical protein